jgi:hypothetical protein
MFDTFKQALFASSMQNSAQTEGAGGRVRSSNAHAVIFHWFSVEY